MAKNNAINNFTQELTVDPGASGDSFVQFDINTTGEFRIGVDDDASDAFKISQGSALGTNDTFIMTAAGENTKPLQPAFLAYLASTAANVTGSSAYTLGTDALTEVFDQNSDFVTSGTFTAPVTGRYAFFMGAYCGDIGTTNDGSYQIITSNRTYFSNAFDYSAIANPSDEVAISFACFADMDASDTTTFRLALTGAGGDTVDVLGSSTLGTFVAGYLVC